jgi:hypothetical protein
MMRLLGVLVGSALAVGALVVFIGIPEFTTEESVAANTIITLPMRPTPRSETLAENPPETLPAPGPEPPPVAETVANGPDPAVAAEPQTQDPPSQPESPPEEVADGPGPSQAMEQPQQWYAFWSPFRSEIAAAGFVDQLQRVTGLDYRVVKVKPGVYEVAFAYADDDEITVNLSQITAATGLQLPEG